MADRKGRAWAAALSAVLCAMLSARCGARTALPGGVPCKVEGSVESCRNACGEGTTTCHDRFFGPCEVPPQPCTNACGTGTAACVDDALGACQVPVATRPCASVCGAGTETCSSGAWGSCDAPAPGPPTLRATLRDFVVPQPDFLGACCACSPDRGHPEVGIVAQTLGSDGLPVYAATPGACSSTHGAADFDQWYRDVPGVNQSMSYSLPFVLAGATSSYEFNNPAFYAVNDQALGDSGAAHDFTLEAHAQITYVGGETYLFSSDDDLWVFINGQLALDLGGLHAALRGSVALDAMAGALGITKGGTYPIDLFYANRQPPGAALLIEIPSTDIWSCP